MGYQESLKAFRRGDNAGAERLARAALDESVAASDPTGQVDALCMLARCALRDGDLDTVTALAEQARSVAQAAGERRLERMPVHMQAAAARMAGRLAEARASYRESIALNDELGEVRMAALEHRNLAYVELHAGDTAMARQLFAESRRRMADVEDPVLTPYLTFDDAVLASLDGDLAEAARLLAVVDSEFGAQGLIPDPDDAAEIAALRLAISGNAGVAGTD